MRTEVMVSPIMLPRNPFWMLSGSKYHNPWSGNANITMSFVGANNHITIDTRQMAGRENGFLLIML
jgi:hypothetical protein